MCRNVSTVESGTKTRLPRSYEEVFFPFGANLWMKHFQCLNYSIMNIILFTAFSSACRILVKLAYDEADGLLSSDDVPFEVDKDPSVAKGQILDCTWEIYTEKGYQVREVCHIWGRKGGQGWY